MLGAADVAALAAAGVAEVTVARLEPGDLSEDAAAAAVAAALAADPAALGLSLSAPFTGRVNVFAETAGLLRVDAAAVAALNGVDPAITLATLPDLAGCGRGRWWRRSRSSPTRSAARRSSGRRRACGWRGAAGGGVPAGAREPDPDPDAGDEAEPDRQGRRGGCGRGWRRSARRWRRR